MAKCLVAYCSQSFDSSNPSSLPSLIDSPLLFGLDLIQLSPHILSLTLPHLTAVLSFGSQVMVLLQCPGRSSRKAYQDQHHEHEQAKQTIFSGHGPLCAHIAFPATLGTH